MLCVYCGRCPALHPVHARTPRRRKEKRTAGTSADVVCAVSPLVHKAAVAMMGTQVRLTQQHLAWSPWQLIVAIWCVVHPKQQSTKGSSKEGLTAGALLGLANNEPTLLADSPVLLALVHLCKFVPSHSSRRCGLTPTMRCCQLSRCMHRDRKWRAVFQKQTWSHGGRRSRLLLLPPCAVLRAGCGVLLQPTT